MLTAWYLNGIHILKTATGVDKEIIRGGNMWVHGGDAKTQVDEETWALIRSSMGFTL